MTTLAVNTVLVSNTYLDCRGFAKGRQLCLAGSPAGTSYKFYGSSDGSVLGALLGSLLPDANGSGVLNLPQDCSPYIKFVAVGSTGTVWVAGQNGAAAVVVTGTEVSEITIGTSLTDMTTLGPGRQIYVTGGVAGDEYTFYASRTSSGALTTIGKAHCDQNRQLTFNIPNDSSLYMKYANASGIAPTVVGLRGPLFPAS